MHPNRLKANSPFGVLKQEQSAFIYTGAWTALYAICDVYSDTMHTNRDLYQTVFVWMTVSVRFPRVQVFLD